MYLVKKVLSIEVDVYERRMTKEKSIDCVTEDKATKKVSGKLTSNRGEWKKKSFFFF